MARNNEFERTQPSNPHQLVVKQHIFPKASIRRFVNTDGCVDLLDLKRSRRRRAAPGDTAFCTMRKWDQKTETLLIKGVEDAFQAFVDGYLSRPYRPLTEIENTVVSRFYAMWRVRADLRDASNKDHIFSTIVAQDNELSKDDQERLEKAGVMFIRGRSYPARFANGMQLLRNFDHYLSMYPDLRWWPWQVAVGEIVVPDQTSALIVPISPKLFLTSANEAGIVHPGALATINRSLAEDASEYIFAHDLSKCLGLHNLTSALSSGPRVIEEAVRNIVGRWRENGLPFRLF